MNCPNCLSTITKEQKKTVLGYRTFRCRGCQHAFNERSDTPFNFLEYPTEIVLLVVLWRLRYKLSLRDVAEMILERGFVFTHETVRDWEARFAPLIAEQLRAKRRGQAGWSWYVDETYIKVHGKWCYLYRSIDHDGNLVDCMLSQKRDMKAAQCFFQQVIETVDHAPRPMDTTRIHEPSVKPLARMSSTEPAGTSIIAWNRITAESSSAITPCVVLEVLRLQLVFVVLLMRYANSSVSVQS